MSVRILQGDCREVMAGLPAASVDSIVCDPPYELGFMGKGWDSTGIANDPKMWAEALRVLKPGGHLLAFSGTRTYHRMVCAIEDAGFEIRDQIGWVYGSGFPKSLDVSKAIDKVRDGGPAIRRVTAFVAASRDAAGQTNGQIDAAFGFNGMAGHWTNTKGPQAAVPKWEQWERLRLLLSMPPDMDAEVWRLNGRKGTPGEAWADREILGQATDRRADGTVIGLGHSGELNRATSDAARQWQGWGTALKPAWEPIVVARKPLIGTVAANVLAHGTGALNIDGCRVPGEPWQAHSATGLGSVKFFSEGEAAVIDKAPHDLGRWPANIIHDGSDEVLAAFPQTTSVGHTPATRGRGGVSTSGHAGQGGIAEAHFDSGSAARFFYTAKASSHDRNDGLHGLAADTRPAVESAHSTVCAKCNRQRVNVSGACQCPQPEWVRVPQKGRANHHPTVKPTDLMRYLCRLVTPPGGTVLDPFMGSGSTLKAAELEGFSAIGIELDPAYIEIARRRISSDAPLFADVA